MGRRYDQLERPRLCLRWYVFLSLAPPPPYRFIFFSAGHFYALFQSVSVQCNDPTTPSASDTSYMYGANSSLDTPSIAFSNASTMINGAPALIGMSTGTMSMWLGVSVALALGGLVL